MPKEKDVKEKKSTAIFWVDKNGKRIDGRAVSDLRPIKIEAGVLPNVDGSCYLEWGQNKVLVSVSGPRECLPKHEANPYKAIVRYTYRMASFSVPDRKNPRPGRREIEISKVSGEALERAVFLERFPNTAIDVFVEVLDSNAGTRIACLTAASVAMADAGIPMRDLVTGITVGRADGTLIVDLNKHEEDAPDAVDMAVAFLPNSKEVVLLQMDGEITPGEFKELNAFAVQEVDKVYELQKEALKNAFSNKTPEPIPDFVESLDKPIGDEKTNPDWEEEPKDPFSFDSNDFEQEEENTTLGEENLDDAEHEAYDAGKE